MVVRKNRRQPVAASEAGTVKAPTHSRASRLVTTFGSNKFFYFIVGLFAVQALWIALLGAFPMAFDEEFHLGLIQFYANHLSPFLQHQPVSADSFGAITRDPSYLYHYLMSFPYRVTGWFTHDETLRILWLRGLNVVMFAASLPLYRRLLQRTKASAALINCVLLFLVLVPVVSLTAAQINYDNLFMIMVPFSLLLTLKFTDELRATKRININRLLWLGTVCMLASLVKYAFLPIFIVIVAFLIRQLYRTYPGGKHLGRSLAFGLSLMTRRLRWVMAILFMGALLLFSQRYAVNFVRYHNPTPACDAVLNVQRCSAYGPWNRDYGYLQSNLDGHKTKSFTLYMSRWFYGMWLRTQFSLAGPSVGYQTRGPLMIPGLVTVSMAVVSLLLLVWYGRRIFAKYSSHALGLLTAVAGFYVFMLIFDGYSSFRKIGHISAINGRYLLPILAFILLLAGMSLVEFLRRWQTARLLVTMLVLLGMAWGGGALTYLLRSNPGWYLPDTRLSEPTQAIQRTVGPWVPGYEKPSEFLFWN